MEALEPKALPPSY